MRICMLSFSGAYLTALSIRFRIADGDNLGLFRQLLVLVEVVPPHEARPDQTYFCHHSLSSAFAGNESKGHLKNQRDTSGVASDDLSGYLQACRYALENRTDVPSKRSGSLKIHPGNGRRKRLDTWRSGRRHVKGRDVACQRRLT